jgi:hypothetical protein
MPMASFAKIDVKEIECDASRSDFPENEIETLADLILSGGGIFRPLILKQVGIEKYLILDGNLEYFASVRAREKNPKKGEMVNAFVVTSSDEITIQEQIKVLKSAYREDSGSGEQVSLQIADRKNGKNSEWISSFEKRLSEIREEFFQVRRDHEYRFTQLEKNINEAENSDLLEIINTLDRVELISELHRYGVAKGKAEAISDARNNQESKKFDSYQDIVKVTKGMGASGILSLIDAWERINKQKR